MAYSLPRVYALDIIVPVLGKAPHHPVVVDVNGSRSSLLYAQQRFGDARLEHEVLSLIAKAGDGRIFSPVVRSAPTLTENFSLSTLLDASPSSVGINRMADAYTPVGPEFTLADEYKTAAIAKSLGIEYATVYADWSQIDRSFRLSINNRDIGLLERWDPGTSAIWPYSWDRRIFPFPKHFLVKESLIHYILTTDKLLLAAVDAKMQKDGLPGLAIPVTHSFGFLKIDSEFASQLTAEFGSNSLAIVKPALGRRGFGVFVTPTNNLERLAGEIGTLADFAGLERGRKILAASSLWGCFPDAGTVVQPYIQSVMRQHPITSNLHSTIHRATVIASEGNVRCLDVSCVLATIPYDANGGGIQRSSLIQENNIASVCLDPQPHLATLVSEAAEHFVAQVEGFAQAFTDMDEVSLLRWECLTGSSFGDRTHEIAVLPTVEEAWSSSSALLEFFTSSKPLTV